MHKHLTVGDLVRTVLEDDLRVFVVEGFHLDYVEVRQITGCKSEGGWYKAAAKFYLPEQLEVYLGLS